MSAHSDSSAPEPARDSRLGLLLSDRYRIDSLVDRGAMGRVYLGEHVLMRKRVAIKVLHRELTSVPEFVARFEREAMAAANIDNEHVVAATDFGKLPDGAVFLVLEYVEGKNLRDEIMAGPMPVVRALHIGRQIGYALRTAHGLGIVHRDLKPENVMLVEKAGDPDFVKVLDFGIAKVPIGQATSEEAPADRPITKAGMVFGTPEYMSPEQALGQNVDARADLYSLGVMIYEMLAGCRPFVAKSQVGVLGLQLSTDVPPMSARAPGVFVPPAVERFVRKLLAREASDRFQTAEAVLDEIDVHLGYAPGRERIPTLRDGSTLTEDTLRGLQADEDDRVPTRSIPVPGVSKPLDKIAKWVDRRRGSLPDPLRKLPAPVLLSVPMAAAGLVVGFGVVAALSSPPGEKAVPAASASISAGAAAAPEATAVPKARADELRVATIAGLGPLESLAKTYPKDGAVRLAIAGAQLKEKDHAAATQALAEALTLSPELASDAQVASALFVLAQSKKSSSAAFEILKGPMGARGRNILHDLTTTAGVREAVKTQAQAALAELDAKK